MAIVRILLIWTLLLPGYLLGQDCYEKYKSEGQRFFSIGVYDRAENHFKAAKECDDCIGERQIEIEALIDSAINFRVQRLERLLREAQDLQRANDSIARSLRLRQKQLINQEKKLQKALDSTRILARVNDSLAEVEHLKAEASRVVGEAVVLRDGNTTLGLRLTHEAVKMSENQSLLAKTIRKEILGRSENVYYQKVFAGHHKAVSAISVSANPKIPYVASGSDDYTVKVWNYETGAEVFTFLGHKGPITDITFSRNGKLILSSSADSTAILWDAEKGEKVRSFIGNGSKINAVAYTNNMKHILTGTDQGMVFIWNAYTGVKVDSIRAHRSPVTAIDFSYDDLYFITGSKQRLVIFWEFKYNQNNEVEIKRSKVHRGHAAAISTVSFLGNTGYFLTGSVDGNLKLWYKHKRKELYNSKAHETVISDISSPKSFPSLIDFYFVTSSYDNTFKLWEVKAPRKRFWNRRRGSFNDIQTYKGHNDPVTSVGFIPEGFQELSSSFEGGIQLISGSRDQTLKGWNLSSSTAIRNLAKNRQLLDVGTSKNPSTFSFATIGRNNEIQTDLFTDNSSNEESFFLERKKEITTAASYSPDNKYLLTGHDNGTISLWPLQKNKSMAISPKLVLKAHKNQITSLSFWPSDKSPENTEQQYILSTSLDSTIKIWEIHNDTLKIVKEFTGHRAQIYSAVFSHDKTFMLSSGSDNSVYLWHLTQSNLNSEFPRPIQKIAGHSDIVRTMAFSTDDQLILTGSDDNSARLWEMGRSRRGDFQATEIQVLKSPESGVSVVSFADQSNDFLIGDNDGKIRVWELADNLNQDHPATEVGIISNGRYPIKNANFSSFLGNHDDIYIYVGDQAGNLNLFYHPIYELDSTNQIADLRLEEKIQFGTKWEAEECLQTNNWTDLTACIYFYEDQLEEVLGYEVSTPFKASGSYYPISRFASKELEMLNKLYEKAFQDQMFSILPEWKVKEWGDHFDEKINQNQDSKMTRFYQDLKNKLDATLNR